MRAVVFPGQGAQCIGMAGDLFDRYAELTAQADEVLGFSLRALCLDDPARLNATRYTQPALFVVCYLRYLDYELAHGPPALLAGHSIGEYAALAAAGALAFNDALKLVNSRACTMADIGGGAMAALVGPGRQEVCALIADFSAAGLEIANENSPTQTVVAGLAQDVLAFIDFCKNRRVRAVRLNVSGAFHSSHMRPAAEQFAKVLAASKFDIPRIPVVSNVTARLHDSDPGRAMARHLDSPVLWERSVKFMLDFGITSFVEIGPRSILTPMIEEIKAARGRGGKPAAPRRTGPDGWSPEFASAAALSTHAPYQALLAFLLDLYRAPPPAPGQLHRSWLALIDRLAAEKLPCTVPQPPLHTSARGMRRYLRDAMQLVHQAILQASAAVQPETTTFLINGSSSDRRQ